MVERISLAHRDASIFLSALEGGVPKKGVATGPGQGTEIFRLGSSAASDAKYPEMACFDAAYDADNGTPNLAATEDVTTSCDGGCGWFNQHCVQ